MRPPAHHFDLIPYLSPCPANHVPDLPRVRRLHDHYQMPEVCVYICRADGELPILRSLHCTGTQRVKAGQQDPSKGGTQKKKKLSAPSGGTKQLKRPEGNKGGGLLQRLGSQSTRRARKDPNTVQMFTRLDVILEHVVS